jgi:peptide/nickel transport system substrate-binding protein
LTFPAYSSNTSAEADILSGKTQWAGLFIADAQHTYVPKAPGNHFWYNPANQPACLYTNDAKQPFSNVWVRRAISEVVNRTKVYKQGEYGYEPPSNAGFVQTQFKKTWGNPSVLKMLNPKGNLKAAKADMKQAMKNPATASAIKNNTFEIVVVSGWTDWDASVAIVASELKAIGIKAVENATDFNTYNSDLNNGTYDMGMSWTYGGLPNPYPIYKFGFGGAFYVPDGKDSNGNNRERYKNPKLDQLINAFAATTKQGQQVKDMKKMESIVASDVPIVPLVTQAYWYEYNTAKFTGFPTSHNPYEIGSPYQNYEVEDVILHVHLK